MSQQEMSKSEIKREFLKSISALIDDHAKGDIDMMTKLEDFTRDVFIVIDGCTDTEPVFLSVGAYIEDIISGQLHHEFIRIRNYKNPHRLITYKEMLRQCRLERKQRESETCNVQ